MLTSQTKQQSKEIEKQSQQHEKDMQDFTECRGKFLQTQVRISIFMIYSLLIQIRNPFEELILDLEKRYQAIIEALEKKDRNQKIEINRMYQRNKQLLQDKENLQKEIEKTKEDTTVQTSKTEEKITATQKENASLVKANEAFKLKVAGQAIQIESLSENNMKLQIQVRNSVDKSIATDLFKDFNKLFEKKLGISVHQKECQICCHYYDHNDRKPVTTKCGHINCKSCMTSLANSSQKCPDCRAPFQKEDLIPLNLDFDEL